MTTTELLELLCQRFPKCFVRYEARRRPLKLGIHSDLLAALGDQVDRKQLGEALRYYTSNIRYRAAQTAGAPWIDLDGNEAGVVSEADAVSAAKDAANRKAKTAARRQQAMRKPAPSIEPQAEPVIEPPAPPKPPRRDSLSALRAAVKLRKTTA